MSWRFAVSVAVLASLTKSVPATAQSCDSDCVGAIEAMLEWVAAEHDTPLAQIVIDTTRSGYGRSAAQGMRWEKRVTPSVLARSQQKLGVMMKSPDELFACEDAAVTRPRPPRCEWHLGRALVRFFAPQVEGDFASMSVDVTWKTRADAESRTKVYSLALIRTPTGWRVDKATVTGWS